MSLTQTPGGGSPEEFGKGVLEIFLVNKECRRRREFLGIRVKTIGKTPFSKVFHGKPYFVRLRRAIIIDSYFH